MQFGRIPSDEGALHFHRARDSLAPALRSAAGPSLPGQLLSSPVLNAGSICAGIIFCRFIRSPRFMLILGRPAEYGRTGSLTLFTTSASAALCVAGALNCTLRAPASAATARGERLYPPPAKRRKAASSLG